MKAGEMARLNILATVLGALLAGGAVAQGAAVESLRGATPVPDVNPSGIYRMERHDRPIPRNYALQPPIIPHNVKGYQITKNVNMCMVCHAAKNAEKSGATPVSITHYFDRDDNKLPNISARRYFCLQCHVPQYDAEPLVGNTFKPEAD